ncbi:MAG: YigZ family protein [Acidobacteria bacterium]|nr:MAG: YigZ family protein [Acidobacteriota bacterium]PIE89972.1 MAG: YigZ family protein [Acidobacteriota bacterium]
MTRFTIPAPGIHREQIEIKRSRFIGSIAHTPQADDARAFIKQMKDQYADATHNCWAYVAGPPGDTRMVGLSDDGEPHGTAGKPMLTVLLHSGVGELTCVVTRYYGGTKLGTGGLVKAYSQAVEAVLKRMPRSQYVPSVQVETGIDYQIQTLFRKRVEEYGIAIEEEVFSDRVQYLLTVPEDQYSAFEKALLDLSNGRSVLSRL